MHFEFIDGTRNDKGTRRIARSHAMKGKNAGRKHPNRRRQGARLQPQANVPGCEASTVSDVHLVQRALTGGPGADEPELLPLHLPFDTTLGSLHVIKLCE